VVIDGNMLLLLENGHPKSGGGTCRLTTSSGVVHEATTDSNLIVSDWKLLEAESKDGKEKTVPVPECVKHVILPSDTFVMYMRQPAARIVHRHAIQRFVLIHFWGHNFFQATTCGHLPSPPPLRPRKLLPIAFQQIYKFDRLLFPTSYQVAPCQVTSLFFMSR
jgi:hypothetical protein